jgi:hypothetical protein
MVVNDEIRILFPLHNHETIADADAEGAADHIRDQGAID